MAAAAQIKQLEDELARYERIVSDCSRCKAALAIEGGDNATSLSPQPAGSSRPIAPKVLSKVSTPSPTTRQGQPTRPSKRAPSTSQAKPSSASQPKASSASQTRPSSIFQPRLPLNESDVVGSTSTHGHSDHSGASASGPPTNTAGRPQSRLSKQTTAEATSSLPGSSSTQLTFTSPALDFRPTSIKPKSRNQPHKSPPWLAAADKMLSEVPTGWVWHARIVQVDRSLLAAVATDTIFVPDDATGAVNDTQNKDRLLKLVQGFAHRHSVQRVNFQNFLLVCLCRVLLAKDFPQNSIVEILQICVSDTGDVTIGRYLQGAKWINKLLNRLFFTDWGYRAVDLMAIWDRSIATYAKIGAPADPTIEYFVSHLTQSEYFTDVEEIPNRTHGTIPWMVKKELGDNVSYATICKALGYSHEYISETKHLHSCSQPESESNMAERDSASESGSFHTPREPTDGDPATQNPKRRLPDSPTSQSQSNDPTRRRQHEGEDPDREEVGSSSRHGKKDSHRRRDRA